MKRSPPTDNTSLFGDQDIPQQLSPELALRETARKAALSERRKVATAAQDRVLSLIASLPVNAICGLDEVGRGPLAGPVCAAAVVLNPDKTVHGLNDSKQLSAAVRDALDPLIRANALGWGLGWVWPEEIERLNIHYASLLAMRRAFAAMVGMPLEKGQPQQVSNTESVGPIGEQQAVLAPLAVSIKTAASQGTSSGILSAHWRHRLVQVIVDGKHLPDLSGLPWEGGIQSLVKGDALCPAISAASIIAKVARDNWMRNYARLDDRYGFEQHMGYGTPQHWAAIDSYGPCPIHRLSWLKGHAKAESNPQD